MTLQQMDQLLSRGYDWTSLKAAFERRNALSHEFVEAGRHLIVIADGKQHQVMEGQFHIHTTFRIED